MQKVYSVGNRENRYFAEQRSALVSTHMKLVTEVFTESVKLGIIPRG